MDGPTCESTAGGYSTAGSVIWRDSSAVNAATTQSTSRSLLGLSLRSSIARCSVRSSGSREDHTLTTAKPESNRSDFSRAPRRRLARAQPPVCAVASGGTSTVSVTRRGRERIATNAVARRLGSRSATEESPSAKSRSAIASANVIHGPPGLVNESPPTGVTTRLRGQDGVAGEKAAPAEADRSGNKGRARGTEHPQQAALLHFMPN